MQWRFVYSLQEDFNTPFSLLLDTKRNSRESGKAINTVVKLNSPGCGSKTSSSGEQHSHTKPSCLCVHRTPTEIKEQKRPQKKSSSFCEVCDLQSLQLCSLAVLMIHRTLFISKKKKVHLINLTKSHSRD